MATERSWLWCESEAALLCACACACVSALRCEVSLRDDAVYHTNGMICYQGRTDLREGAGACARERVCARGGVQAKKNVVVVAWLRETEKHKT